MALTSPLYTMAFITALAGSGHCLGMCGGLVTALSLTAAKAGRSSLFHIFYHLGRVGIYTAAGFAAGAFGSILAYTEAFNGSMRIALILSDLFLVLVGLGTAGLFQKLSFMRLEFAGPVKLVTSLAGSLRRLPSNLAALPLGMVMGFLPCGFLYAMLISAAQTASAPIGAFVMLSFGAGTIPALFAFGWLTHKISTTLRRRLLQTAGLLVACMGAYHFYKHGKMLGWDFSAPLQFICH